MTAQTGDMEDESVLGGVGKIEKMSLLLPELALAATVRMPVTVSHRQSLLLCELGRRSHDTSFSVFLMGLVR